MLQYQKEFDVVVAGGGAAGVAAALAAARRGARTALIEKTIKPGGLATSGLVIFYLPLCDGLGRQVTFGLAEELLLASLRYGPGEVPLAWRRPGPKEPGADRYEVRFSPASFVLALDELLTRAGVEIWFDTLVCAAQSAEGRLTGLEVENKSGRGLIRARCFVDATGDADVAFRAGAPCVEQSNSIALWALEASLDAARQAVEQGSGEPLCRAVMLGADNAGEDRQESGRKFRGAVGKDVSEFALESRRLLRLHYERKYAELGEGARHNLYPIHLPSMAQFRTTRRIDGRRTLSDGMHGRSFEDSVGLVAAWWRRGEVWEIPYGVLLPRGGVSNLLVAGRCISSAGSAWEATRVIQAAAHTGEITGVAAALAVKNGVPPADVPIPDLRAELAARGVQWRCEPER
ncbi:MAG: FAD-dependent oxidoreductase [Planctomycetes bacterium]|nr:FAD-dependent oxidoreductase [Planctomycetota bacterium]